MLDVLQRFPNDSIYTGKLNFVDLAESEKKKLEKLVRWVKFFNLKTKDSRFHERKDDVEGGGSYIAGTEYQFPLGQFLMLITNLKEFCIKNPSFKRYFTFVKI